MKTEMEELWGDSEICDQCSRKAEVIIVDECDCCNSRNVKKKLCVVHAVCYTFNAQMKGEEVK